MKQNNKKRGFGLIELLVVLSIIGLIVALVTPLFGRVNESTRQGILNYNAQRLTYIAKGCNAIQAGSVDCTDVASALGDMEGGVTLLYDSGDIPVEVPDVTDASYAVAADCTFSVAAGATQP